MSIADCRRAFAEGLDGRASCKNAQHGYVDGGKRQRLTFAVCKPNGVEVEVGATILAAVDPVQAAKAMAEYFAATLGGSAGLSVLPVTVEKQRGQVVPVITEKAPIGVSAATAPVSVNEAVLSAQSPVPSEYEAAVSRAGAGASLEALKRELVFVNWKTNDAIEGRTAEWQNEFAKRTAAIWRASAIEEVKSAFESVEAFLRGQT